MTQEYQAILCPYCGHTQRKMDRCEVCGGSFDAVSRRGVAVNMGPWYLHEQRVPFRPGFSYTSLRRLIRAGKVTANSIIKGPSTQQLWAPARLTPGVAHLVGSCPRCEAEVDPDAAACPECDQPFTPVEEHNEMGLPFATSAEARAAQAELDEEVARSGGRSRALKLWHHPDVPVLALCPYCGQWQKSAEQCSSCGGVFDQLSQRATVIAMGPWFVRNKQFPYLPACSYDVLRQQIEAGRINADTIIRGPTTRQFWSVARNVPGFSHLVGFCWSCGQAARPSDARCASCGSPFGRVDAQNALGLAFPTEAAVLAAEQELEAQFHPQTPPTPVAPPPGPAPYAPAGALPAGLNSMTHAAVGQAAFSGLDPAALAVIGASTIEPMELVSAELDPPAMEPETSPAPPARQRHRGGRASRPIIIVAVVVLVAGIAITIIMSVLNNRPQSGVTDGERLPVVATKDGADDKGKPIEPAPLDPKEAKEKATAAWATVRDLSRDGQIGLLLDKIGDLMARADTLADEGAAAQAGGVYADALTEIEALREKVKLRDEASAARNDAAKLMTTIDPTELHAAGERLIEQAKMRFDEAQIYFDNGEFAKARDLWTSVKAGLVNLPERAKGMALVDAAEKKYRAALDRDLDEALLAIMGGSAWKDVTAQVAIARQAAVAERWTDAAEAYRKAAELAPPVMLAVKPLAVRYWTCLAGHIAALASQDHFDGQTLDPRIRAALRPLLLRLRVSMLGIDQAVLEPVTKEQLQRLMLVNTADAIGKAHGEPAAQSFQVGAQLASIARLLRPDSAGKITAEQQTELKKRIAELRKSATAAGFNRTMTDFADALGRLAGDLENTASVVDARKLCDGMIANLGNVERAVSMLRP